MYAPRTRAGVYVCVHVCKKELQFGWRGEGQEHLKVVRERERESVCVGKERGRQREQMCVFVCVCVCVCVGVCVCRIQSCRCIL